MIEAKQNAKQRIRLSEKHRMYNKARKSAIATRMKKVMTCTPVRCVCAPRQLGQPKGVAVCAKPRLGSRTQRLQIWRRDTQNGDVCPRGATAL